MAEVRVSRQAAKDLERLPKMYLAAAASALRDLGPAPLAGKPLAGDLTGLRSRRVGMYLRHTTVRRGGKTHTYW